MTALDAPTAPLPTESVSTGAAAMHALRATRKRHRLGDIEWFDAAYKVYVVGLFGGIVLLWLSDLVGDVELSADQARNVADHAPAILGMVAVLAFVAGLRSGAQGGPLALEAADVTHVMLAPVPRRAALLRPTVQRMRSAAFAGIGVAACLAQLAGRRLPGTPIAWFAGGGLFGLNVALLWVGAALVAHALRIPLLLTTFIGVAAVAWQATAIAADIPGPGNLDGSLGLWGWRQRGIDVIPLILTATLVTVGVLLVARTSLEALARRSSLVAQLRFAVTMQDLRTVMLLRRQLSQENTRQRPWIRLRRGGGSAVIWRRGWHSLLRFPVSRLLRMVLLAIGAAASQVAAFKGTTAMFLVSGLLLFLLGMETMEPLSQEIDQPDRLAALPHDRGSILVRHTIVPVIVLIPFALIGLATVVALERSAGALAVGAVMALPTVWLGAAGAAVSIVKDAPDLTSAAVEQTMLPPEMSGLTTIVRGLIPLVVSVIGAVGVVLVRSAHEQGNSEIGAAVRIGVFQLLLSAFVGVWVRRRDEWKRKFKNMMAEGREQTAQQRASRQSTRSL